MLELAIHHHGSAPHALVGTGGILNAHLLADLLVHDSALLLPVPVAEAVLGFL